MSFTVTVAKLLPNSDVKAVGSDRIDQARDSVAKFGRGEVIAGWGSLSSFVPDAVIEDVRERLGLIDHSMDWPNERTLGARDALESACELTEVKPTSRYVGDLALIEYPAVISYPTGIEPLDKLLGGGMSTQQVIAILGKPGAGKSALVISWTLALELIIPVLYCTTELGTNEIVARLCAPVLGCAWRDIVRGKAITSDGRDVTREILAETLRGKRIAVIGQDEIYFAGDKAVELIAREAQKMKAEHGVCPVIFVDYMQELARGEPGEVRTKTTKVAVTFRQVAQALDGSVGLVCSIGRSGYNQKGTADLRQGDDPTAYMALAKESGDIDYAAATILFVDVDDQSDGNGWKLGRIAVAKSRHGEVGFAGVRFHGATGRWEACEDGINAMSQENREARQQAKQVDKLEERLFAKVTELAAYGTNEFGKSKLMSRSDLTTVVTGKKAELVRALGVLLESGRLYETDEIHTNPLTRRMELRKVIALDPNNSTAIAKELPAPTIAEIMGLKKPE